MLSISWCGRAGALGGLGGKGSDETKLQTWCREVVVELEHERSCKLGVRVRGEGVTGGVVTRGPKGRGIHGGRVAAMCPS